MKQKAYCLRWYTAHLIRVNPYKVHGILPSIAQGNYTSRHILIIANSILYFTDLEICCMIWIIRQWFTVYTKCGLGSTLFPMSGIINEELHVARQLGISLASLFLSSSIWWFILHSLDPNISMAKPMYMYYSHTSTVSPSRHVLDTRLMDLPSRTHIWQPETTGILS